ncbi:MAG: hypothetical protein AUJ75_00440 [Candidatus Omnitrophica bacterium CG1_02_49_10]|nr:MAG: hypothetical protein AUJ75_00440 [Candidatus Omnitrophica bacterium CG1_02_49_10]
MKIGVVSDLHIPNYSKGLPEALVKAFSGVDRIILVGDVTTPDGVTLLEGIAPVTAVCGNMDEPILKRRFPEKDIVNLGGFAIGLYHGSGSPEHLLERVAKRFESDKVDVIVFGHSHTPLKVHKDGVLFLNPGSPTDKIFSPYNSCAIIEINDKLDAKIVRLE